MTNKDLGAGGGSLPEQLYTAKEIAALAKVSERTIRRWIDEGRLPVVRLGRSVRIREADYRKLVGIRRSVSSRFLQ